MRLFIYIALLFNVAFAQCDSIPHQQLNNAGLPDPPVYGIGDNYPFTSLVDTGGSGHSFGTGNHLIINGSYSCTWYTWEIINIDSLQAQYGVNLDIILIYTVEAKPDTVNPLDTACWSQSYKQWGTFKPPQNKGMCNHSDMCERREAAKKSLSDFPMNPGIAMLLDDSQNTVWNRATWPICATLVCGGVVVKWWSVFDYQPIKTEINNCLSITGIEEFERTKTNYIDSPFWGNIRLRKWSDGRIQKVVVIE